MKNNFKASNKKRKIIKSYDSSAHFYDQRYRAIQEKKFVQTLGTYVITDKKILDLGCGTGLLFEFISKSGSCKRKFDYSYVAIDISLNMLIKFKSKLFNLKDGLNLSLLLSDMEHLPFRDNTFNLIVSFTSFQNLLKHEQGIRELVRVAVNNSDLKFSILKKKIKLPRLLASLKPNLKNLEIHNKKLIEDIIIQGKIAKPNLN